MFITSENGAYALDASAGKVLWDSRPGRRSSLRPFFVRLAGGRIGTAYMEYLKFANMSLG